MFYKLIYKKRNQWFDSKDCTVNELINYIIQQGQLRDAQIEAIKTYLYLKIVCKNRPLWELFTNGEFNSLTVDELELTTSARETLQANNAAMALMEYARLKDKNGKQLAPELEKFIKCNS